MMLLEKMRSILLIIDVQEKLLPVMDDQELVVKGCTLLLAAAHELHIPILVSEQYPKGLGHTYPDILKAAGGAQMIEKTSFSCSRNHEMDKWLTDHSNDGRKQIVLAGIESHVCVLQTALDLLGQGYEVYVVADAVSSRLETSKETALARMRQAGITIISAEMAIFEWLERCDIAEFKALAKLVK